MPIGCCALTPLPMADEVFRHLVAARIIEPTNKVDALRVLSAVTYFPRFEGLSVT